MDADYAIRLLTETLLAAAKMSAPILLATLVVGLAISIVQVVTQVQEMTLTFVPKILAVMITDAVSAPFIGAQISIFTDIIFSRIQSGF